MANIVNEEMDALSQHLARTIRSLRQARGWSLATLGTRASLSKTIISKIEAGDGNPSIETLLRLADALDVTIGSLLDATASPGTRIIRLDEKSLVRSESGLLARSVFSDGRNRRVDTHELVVEAGVDYLSAPHPPGTEELVICAKGSMTVGPEGFEVSLGERDAAMFGADVPHRYRSESGCLAISVMSYPASA